MPTAQAENHEKVQRCHTWTPASDPARRSCYGRTQAGALLFLEVRRNRGSGRPAGATYPGAFRERGGRRKEVSARGQHHHA